MMKKKVYNKPQMEVVVMKDYPMLLTVSGQGAASDIGYYGTDTEGGYGD